MRSVRPGCSSGNWRTKPASAVAPSGSITRDSCFAVSPFAPGWIIAKDAAMLIGETKMLSSFSASALYKLRPNPVLDCAAITDGCALDASGGERRSQPHKRITTRSMRRRLNIGIAFLWTGIAGQRWIVAANGSRIEFRNRQVPTEKKPVEFFQVPFGQESPTKRPFDWYFESAKTRLLFRCHRNTALL